jgi:rhodanese-related sulfurtransferase
MGSYIIVDVRTGSDWNGSEFKIRGAVRPSVDIVSFAKSQGLAKNAKIVLYCA